MASAEEQLNEQGEKALIRRRVKVTIPKDRLTASINISPPTSDEPPVTEQEVFKSLQDAGVVYGIDNDKVVWSVAERRFGEPIEVAQGKPMVQGKHTEFEYFFQTENRFQPQEDEDGRIDYRDMGYIQNATKDMLMIRRTLPQEGTPGVGVDGQPIDAPRGRNIPFNHGENIRVSEDGLELYANCDGAIVFSRGRVAIKDVMQIKDVDFNVGNIDCVGSVRVTGNICSGFSVRVGGDLEVNGGIEDATVYCAGNILVRGGMFGGGEGSVTAEGDITVKYAQGSKISAGGDVVVGGELLNCQVTARGNVLVKGRKGKIAGGEINAAKEIQAHEIGSDAGTQTVLTVAFDENLMRAYPPSVSKRSCISSISSRWTISYRRSTPRFSRSLRSSRRASLWN